MFVYQTVVKPAQWLNKEVSRDCTLRSSTIAVIADRTSQALK